MMARSNAPTRGQIHDARPSPTRSTENLLQRTAGPYIGSGTEKLNVSIESPVYLGNQTRRPNGPGVREVPKPGRRRLLRLAHGVSALRSVCASAISGNSGVGEKPFSADASTAWMRRAQDQQRA